MLALQKKESELKKREEAARKLLEEARKVFESEETQGKLSLLCTSLKTIINNQIKKGLKIGLNSVI